MSWWVFRSQNWLVPYGHRILEIFSIKYFHSIMNEMPRGSWWMQFIQQIDQDSLIGVLLKEWFKNNFLNVTVLIIGMSLEKRKIEGVRQQQWISLNDVHRPALREMKMVVREVLVGFSKGINIAKNINFVCCEKVAMKTIQSCPPTPSQIQTSSLKFADDE